MNEHRLPSLAAISTRDALDAVAAVPTYNPADPVETRLDWVLRIQTAPDRVVMMRELMADTDRSERLRLARRFPVQIGNCFNGAPFELCTVANQIAAIGYAATADGADKAFYGGLREPTNPGSAGPPEYRQVLYVNPKERSGLIEAHGDLTTAEHAAVFQPGANTDHASLDRRNAIARGFVEARPDRDLAMITCAMDNLPGHTGATQAEMYRAAADRRPAERIARRLRDFMSLVRWETAADPSLMGHSFGGLIAAIAAAGGVDASRLLLVNAAGSGLPTSDARGYRDRDGRPIRTFVLDHPEDYVISTRLATPHFGPGVGQLAQVTHLAAPSYIPDHPDLPAEQDKHIDLLRPWTTSFENVLGVMTGGSYRTGEPPSGPKATAQRILDGVLHRPAGSGSGDHDFPAVLPRRRGRRTRAR